MAGEENTEFQRPITHPMDSAGSPPPMNALSESQIMRVLGEPPPDSFTILNRQIKRALSDTTVVGILLSRVDPSPGTVPIPLASRFTRLTRPLNYGSREECDRDDNPLARLPIPYRVARLVLWLGVAAELVVVIVNSLRIT